MCAFRSAKTASAVSAVGELSSDDLDVPATSALVGDDLWTVNARFGIEVTPESARRVIGVLSLAEQSSAKGKPLPMPYEDEIFGSE